MEIVIIDMFQSLVQLVAYTVIFLQSNYRFEMLKSDTILVLWRQSY